MKRLFEMVYDFLVEVVIKEDIVVDVIMGNGYDMIFLVKLVK